MYYTQRQYSQQTPFHYIINVEGWLGWLGILSGAPTRVLVPGMFLSFLCRLRLYLDAVVFTLIHMCWCGLRWNLVQVPHFNPPQHMWIDVNPTTSKQGPKA
jgi:hypothetical protein